MFYVIAALFLAVGAVLLIATRQRHATPAARQAAPAAGAKQAAPKPAPPKEAPPKPQRVKIPGRARHKEPEPERISREEYLRQLAERSAGKPVHREPR